MNTKVCAILFAGATLVSSSDKEQTTLATEEPVSQGRIRNIGRKVFDKARDAKDYFVGKVGGIYEQMDEEMARSRVDDAAKAYRRTTRLQDLVDKVQHVIQQLQAPAGCDQTEEERKEIQGLIKKTMDTVVKAMKDFEEKLPEGAKAWMTHAKSVLTNFPQKINGQPTEDDIKALLEDLNIKGLEEVVKNVEVDDNVREEDKKTMQIVQNIVTPLQNATDTGSFLKILKEECIPAMDQLEDGQFEKFMDVAEEHLATVPKFAEYFKCEAAKAAKAAKMEM